MITNTGQSILAKYLVGQAPAYASYIAIGCGATPVLSSHTFSEAEITSMKEKESLDFEMFRIPVTSRGYVTEGGESKIVFTGELPTLDRYDITEVGIWSAGSNPSAKFNDSRTIFLFNKDEGWEYNSSDGTPDLPEKYDKLDLAGEITTTDPVFITNADNPTFADTSLPNSRRSKRYEGARFLNSTIAIRGDVSDIIVDADTGRLTITDEAVLGYPNHLRLTGATVDLDKSSPKDELRLAFSVINKDSGRTVEPYDVKIIVEFAQGDIQNEGEYARFETILDSKNPDGSINTDVDFENQRYFISKARLEELNRSSGFTWKIADVVKVFVTVREQDPNTENIFISDEFYVCLDALRLENTTNLNPIYGLTGYSIVKNTTLKPVTKIANSSSHIEFRFGLDVL
jgi:hypothetical protein